MSRRFNISVLFIILSFIGCDEQLLHPDLTPPSVPRNVYAEAGDQLIGISWDENPEADIAGYNVFVGNSVEGRYNLIGSTTQTHFVDKGTTNGKTYYYRISAYDFHGNESALSHEFAYATPRPEQYNEILKDYRTYPDEAGFDFSTSTVVRYNDQLTDIFFEYNNGIYYLDVWEDTEIQDVGYTNSLYDIIEAPTSGWSPTKDVRLIVGHIYIIRTWDYHYAKVRIIYLNSTKVIFDWVYQLQAYNTQLKINEPTIRKPIIAGPWLQNR